MAQNRSKTSARSLSLLLASGGVAALAAFSPAAESPGRDRTEAAPASSEAPAEPAGWALAALGDAEPEGAEEAAGAALSGLVAEQLDVTKYSYLRLTGGEHDTWVAVPLTTSRVGTRVTLSNAELMTRFASAALKRTFDEIYFGALDEAPAATLPVTEHPSPELSMALAEADPHSTQQAPHPGPGKSADSVPVTACEKAPGPLGHTVAELHALNPSAAGSKARVRATVVKVTSGVMGRTFIHLRDGSGTAPFTHDLTATTADEPTVGSQVLLEGTIRVNEDFGSGYRYSVLLADARAVTP